jgi:pimeloyl-ACP methyl ester carboxylesterase
MNLETSKRAGDLHKPYLKYARTPRLSIAYEEQGPAGGRPVVLLHGFPDDVRAWDGVAPPLAREGYRIVVPYLRGFGATRFLEASAPRVGQQAALGKDVLDLLDALAIPKATLAGFDWGCTAACVAAILQPDRIDSLVAIHGYGVRDTLRPEQPEAPEEERECWYHWYFQIERGRRGLEANRRELCRLLWKSWSPTWRFAEETFERTAASFDNPDFVPVVIHAYRHSHGNDAGDPSLAGLEERLATLPSIAAPAIVLHGDQDTVHPLHRSLPDMKRFPERTRRVVVQDAGHFVPREQPGAVVEAIRSVREGA